MELTDKQVENLRMTHAIQASTGNWDYDPYMHGMYNGMELMLAIIEGRDPDFRKAPDVFLADKKTDDVTIPVEPTQVDEAVDE